MAGEHCLHRFTNRDIRSQLTSTRLLRVCADDSLEGKCEGQPLLQAAARPRAHRKDPAHAQLARDQLRPQCHGHFAIPARAPLPKRLLRRHALIIFAKNKEVTAKEFILTANTVPPGTDVDALRAVAREHFQAAIAGGLGPLADRVFRIGHLSDQNPASVLGALAGVEAALLARGVPVGDGGLQRVIRHLAMAPGRAPRRA